MNKIILLATLTKDVELRYLQNGSAMATLNLAHNKKFKKQDGSQSERVLYVKATCFGKTAEMVNQYFSKGSRILISGELTLNSWADDKGNKRSEHSILIETIDFIEAKNLPYHLGNAVKYISRAGKKEPEKTAEDLKKAVWYINRYISKLEGE